YAGSKAASELYVRGFHKTEGLKMVIVRPFNSYGEYMRDDTYAAAIPNFYNRISKGLPLIIHGTGKQTRDFTYVGDTCHGIMLADQNGDALSKTFNIGQAHDESIKKLAEILITKYQVITARRRQNKRNSKKAKTEDVVRKLA